MRLSTQLYHETEEMVPVEKTNEKGEKYLVTQYQKKRFNLVVDFAPNHYGGFPVVNTAWEKVEK